MRNAYALLSALLSLSVFVAWGFYLILDEIGPPKVPYLGLWMLLPIFGLVWAIRKATNKVWGLAWTFAFTGYLGIPLGYYIRVGGIWLTKEWRDWFILTPGTPFKILDVIYSALMGNPGWIVVGIVLGITTLSFMGLSAYYAITNKQNFGFLRGLLITFMASSMVTSIFSIAITLIDASSFTFDRVVIVWTLVTALYAPGILFGVVPILYRMRVMAVGEQTNYMSATVGRFVSLYNATGIPGRMLLYLLVVGIIVTTIIYYPEPFFMILIPLCFVPAIIVVIIGTVVNEMM